MATEVAIRSAAKAEMLIRKPIEQVFEAFLDPAITSNFWFTQGSGRLEPEHHVRWDWDMYDLSVDVTVQAVEPHERILIEWSANNEPPTTVEWLFVEKNGGTYVSITNEGFSGDPDAVISQVRTSTEGFALVLAGAKAYLEHGLRLNLVADRHPDGLQPQ